MCGIAGFISIQSRLTTDELQQQAIKMGESIVHRGPDDSGIWVDAEAGIALAHRRLSIVDLSPEGHQPMVSPSGRYVIVFNGEIYNFCILREELQRSGYSFRGHSDTEVMLAAIEQFGVEPAIKKFVGMFAFALWDRQERMLILGRDRMGEKPLFYGRIGNSFMFASELKALRNHPDFRSEIDRKALALYMRHNYIPAPYSIYRGIFKLLPGTILTFRSMFPDSELTPVPFWTVREAAEKGVENLFGGSESEAVNRLDQLLRDSVGQQMVADVPLGAFLSGGIDSSTVVAVMQSLSRQPVKTFTIGFHEEGYNEAEHAKAVARHLGTDHTELYVSLEQAMDVIPRLPVLYDEPFSDSSQIPTFLVSQLARQHVTVSLSGDGGDELFGGYNRYFWGRNIWSKIGSIPKPFRQLAARGLTVLSPQTWNSLYAAVAPLVPNRFKLQLPGDKLHKLADILAVESPEAMYRDLVSHWKNPTAVVLDTVEPKTVLNEQQSWAHLPDFTQRMMYLDMMTYLPDDILVKVDRASMGVSLESRVPMLDHRIVEFAWTLPLAMKIRNDQGKWLLRQVLYKYVPKELIERPKMGFGVPIDTWLRGPLRQWAEQLLDEERLRREGFFNPVPIRQKWAEHQSGKRNWQYYLWDVLMFQAWLEQQ
ncbi:asparagine synthase (glutamine-hydrolyzing) [Effusibacillus lacus]|uniref:asparagine synthase (glutamine-hydrolyzing) n=1 Tax=Effusibacillus lacus TaxID=1348429 RepID=A0A292YQ39_9BACL|nr:asparagine synthase (glutamine-hydrolyzing) [Effusibacillus lacus]TCS73728.1 asparagine synthase (glutamine-hydrolysing) [Effusibacillus lacus]GAX92058.1 asparagine synthetase B [Effusibacillus lacus]